MTDILNLSDKALERELAKIIKSSPQRRKFWTEKEDLVLKRLYKAGVDHVKIAEVIGRSIGAIDDRIVRIRD